MKKPLVMKKLSLSKRLAPLVIVVVCTWLIGCEKSMDAVPQEVVDSVLMVDTLMLTAKPSTYQIQSFGRLVSAEKIRVGVEVPGTVTQVYFREGQEVLAGDKLLSLDDAKQKLRLTRAKANVAGAKAGLEQAQQTYKRFASLGDKGAVSKDELNKIASTYANAVAQLAQAKAEQNLAQQQLQDLVVISPVDGIIEAESVEPGQKVQPGEQLGVLQTRGSLQLVTFVNEAEVNHLSIGAKASVEIANAEYEATLESVSVTANVQTGNFEVKLRVPNPDGKLREGMSATVSLSVNDTNPLLVVPRAAVVDRHRKRIVFVIENGTARAKEPRVGLTVGDGLIVYEGLSDGDQLIIAPLSLVSDGMQVSAKPDVTASEAGQ